MGAAREAELAAQLAVAIEDAARLRTQNRRLVDELNDAEEAARVYRRVAHRVISKCAECPLCDPRPQRDESARA